MKPETVRFFEKAAQAIRAAERMLEGEALVDFSIGRSDYWPTHFPMTQAKSPRQIDWSFF